MIKLPFSIKLRHIFMVLLVICSTKLFPNVAVIKGNAKMFADKELILYTYSDYISKQKRQIGYTVIKEDGSYKFEFNAEKILKVFLRIEDKSTWFFVEPGKVYHINLVYDKTFNKGRVYDKKLSLLFNFPAPSELNQMIKSFNKKFDDFIGANKSLIERRDGSILPVLNSFKQEILQSTDYSSSLFVTNYIKYSIASTETALDIPYDIKKINVPLNKKVELYLEYLDKSPVLYSNPEYVYFFKTFFKGEIKELSLTVRGMEITKSINETSSLNALSKALDAFPFLQDPEFKGLFILNGLFELSKDDYFEKKNILTILSEIEKTSNYVVQKKIAKHLIEKITKKKFGKGSMAPIFELKNQKGETISLESFKGKLIYLNFWTTWSTPGLKEMKIINAIYEKYKSKVHFVSICADNDIKKMHSFLENNPEYQWIFLHKGKGTSVLDNYKVATFPKYILIDEHLKILKAPAPRPGGSAEGATEQNLEKVLYDLTNNR